MVQGCSSLVRVFAGHYGLGGRKNGFQVELFWRIENLTGGLINVGSRFDLGRATLLGKGKMACRSSIARLFLQRFADQTPAALSSAESVSMMGP